MTLNDALAHGALSMALDGAVYATLEDTDAYDDTDYAAERYAEMAWLRHAENQGWEEAMQESYYESGLLARPW